MNEKPDAYFLTFHPETPKKENFVSQNPMDSFYNLRDALFAGAFVPTGPFLNYQKSKESLISGRY